LTISSTIAGLVLLVLWRRYSGDLTDTIRRIRARRPPSIGEKIVEGTRT
jgi:hypothetical protein